MMMVKVKVLNPRGLKMVSLWPTLKAIGCTFDHAALLLKGRALTLPAFKAGIVVRLLHDMGHLVDEKRF